MKKIKLLALAFVIGTASLFATNLDVPDVPVKQIRGQVADLFTNPDFAIENDLVVHITFTFSSQGDLVVLAVDSENEDVLNYVRKNMNHKKITTPGELNRIFIMPLRITKK